MSEGIRELYHEFLVSDNLVSDHLAAAGWQTKVSGYPARRYFLPPKGHRIDWWLPLDRAVEVQERLAGMAALPLAVVP